MKNDGGNFHRTRYFDEITRNLDRTPYIKRHFTVLSIVIKNCNKKILLQFLENILWRPLWHQGKGALGCPNLYLLHSQIIVNLCKLSDLNILCCSMTMISDLRMSPLSFPKVLTVEIEFKKLNIFIRGVKQRETGYMVLKIHLQII